MTMNSIKFGSVLTFFSLMISFSVGAIQPNLKEVNYEFGSIEGLDCTNGCSIPFQYEYENPVVFLMSTIDPNNIENSHPTKTSAASIWPSKRGATIESEGVVKDENGKLKYDRMSPIYYFVTEPGKIKFFDTNGNEKFGEVGVVTTRKSQCTKGCNKSNDWENVKLNLNYDRKPVVLSQVQGKDTNWSTTAVSGVTSNNFKLALERGRQGPLKQNEYTKTIAYLVISEFYGTDRDKKHNVEFESPDRTYDQENDPGNQYSIVNACEDNIVNLHQGFEKYGVIAKKQTRIGGHGGWLRRCKTNYGDQVIAPSFTVVFDEDIDSLKNRRHAANENIGYFAFEIPKLAIATESCDLFPEPIQSWERDDGKLSSLSLGNPIKTYGWSQDYLSRYLKDKNKGYEPYYKNVGGRESTEKYLLVGFDDTPSEYQLYAEENVVNEMAGEKYAFDLGNNDGLQTYRKVKKENVTPVVKKESVRFDLLIENSSLNNVKSKCHRHPSDCQYKKVGENHEVTIKGDIRDLTVKGSSDVIRIVFSGSPYIQDFKVENNNKVELVFEDETEATFGTYHDQMAKTSYFFGKSVRLNIIDKIEFTNFSAAQNDVYPIIYAPEGKVIFHSGENLFNGFILGGEVSINSAVINGAITAQSLKFNGGNNVIRHPIGQCPTRPPQTGILKVTPISRISLTCEMIPVEFKLIEKYSGKLIKSSDSFTPLPPSSDVKWCNSADDSNCDNGLFNFEQGKKTLYLSSQIIQEIYVSGMYNQELSEATLVKFVPYRFSAENLRMIAGEKDSKVTVVASSCNDGEVSPVKGYNQSLSFESEISKSLKVPNQKGDIEELKISDASTENNDAQLKFVDGEATISVDWNNVGLVDITLKDPEFSCENFGEDCPIDGKAELVGSFSIKSRPDKFYLCTDTASDGTSSSGHGFVASGDEFKLYVKPAVIGADVNNVCSRNIGVPSNYHHIDTSVDFDIELDSPLKDKGGTLGALTGLPELISPNAYFGYELESLAYSEAGSIKIKVDEAGFFSSTVDSDWNVTGSKTIGRFYPKYFQVTESDWTYPNAQSFSYMGQPFDGVTYSVEALNSNEKSLKNYALFESGVQAKFNIDELGSLSERFDAPNSTGRWDLLDKAKSIGSFTIDGNSFCGADSTNRAFGSACFIKDFDKLSDSKDYADGPYNMGGEVTKIGLVDAKSSDPVSFLNVDTVSDSRLISQPDIRFGRVDLDDVGGRQGDTLHVPLRVEYWNGSRFVVNSNDSQSDVAGVTAAQSHIWPMGANADPKAVTLGAGGTVSSGSSRSITATQAEPYRQQTRVWLDLDDSENGLPWLKYDWDNDGSEENPSSVVTFGIHRGNDRVIYRGEPGLTGQ